MNESELKKLLEAVRDSEMSIDEACGKLKDLPYADLGFASVDHHRAVRTGYPEVIYGENKTPEQIGMIMSELAHKGGNIMATRCTAEMYLKVKEIVLEAVYFHKARIIALVQKDDTDSAGTVAVVTAGTSDIPVAEEAAVTSEMMGAEVIRVYDVGVAGIHRLFARMKDIERADAVVAAAGMEGALASVLGGLVNVPVVAVPTSVGYGANLNGISALLSMLNSCANGVGVVNIDNGFGAGYLAALIAGKCSK